MQQSEHSGDLQRIQVKVFLERPVGFSGDPFIAILDRWRAEDNAAAAPAQPWIDFVDYAHVKDGPGILLVGRELQLSLDFGDGRVAITLRGRRDLLGTDTERFTWALRRALATTNRALADATCPPGLAPSHLELELSVNDRLDFAPGPETEARLRGPIHATFDACLGAGAYTSIALPAAAARYGYVARSLAPRALSTAFGG